MSDLIYISRNFTELGAFKAAEVLDFYKRRVLTTDDFIRLDGTAVWLTLADWMAGATPDAASSATPPVAKGKDSKPKAAVKPKAKTQLRA